MKKLIIIISLFILTLIAISKLNAQIPVRIEIPVKAGYAPINSINAGSNGVALVFPTTNQVGKDSVAWALSMLNTDLESKWAFNLFFTKDTRYLKGSFSNDCIHLLFHDVKNAESENVFFYVLNIFSKEDTLLNIKIPDKSDINEMFIQNNNVWISYFNKNSGSNLIGTGFYSGFQKTILLDEKENAIVLDISSTYNNSGFNVLYKKNEKNNKNSLYLKTYNNSGGLISSKSIPTNDNKRLINSAQFIETSINKGIVAGSYGYGDRSSRRPQNYDNFYDYYNPFFFGYNPYYYSNSLNYDANNDKTPISDGYFTSSYSNNSFDTINYFNFSDFENAYKYISDVESLNINAKSVGKNNSKRKNKRNKESSLQLRLIMHDIYHFNDEFILIAETYVPEYTTSSSMGYSYFGGYYPNTYYTFNGYRYSNAFVASFGEDGKMKWSNGIDMSDILSSMLNKKLNMLFNHDEIVLFFNANNKIQYKSIKQFETVEPIRYTKVETKWKTDKINDEYLGTIQYWYDDFFILTGYQTIINDYLNNVERSVFYIQKIGFR